MARDAFESELERLRDEILIMSSMVVHALNESVASLRTLDATTARQIVIDDEQINRRRLELERDALLLISTQAPVAGDLRLIAAFIELSGEMERIGDYAKGIANIVLYIGDGPLIKPLVDIPLMCEKAVSMLRDSIDAFIQGDLDAAYTIPRRDDEVDALYNRVHADLIQMMLDDAANIDQANYLMWAAHNLERTADRVTNICERIIFTVTGEFVPMDGKPKNVMKESTSPDMSTIN